MLEATPTGLFSRDFSIEAGGQRIAVLDVSWWKEAGEISIAGQPYRLYRESLLGAFVLERQGAAVARATKPSVFRSLFDLELADGLYSLRRAFVFGKNFSVYRGEVEVGSVQRAHWLSRRALIDLPADWPVPVQVFVFWLVLMIWNRRKRA